MAEELVGTFINRGRGEEDASEVESLIRQTLEESKRLEKAMAPVIQEASPVKREEFKATVLTEKAAVSTASGAYEETFKEYKAGDIVKGAVLKIDPSGVLVDIKYKSDGLILPEELSERSFGSPAEVVKVGDVIEVYIENLENKEGYVVLSKKRADYERKWNFAADAYHNKKLIEGKVLQALRGGLLIDCGGICGFIPASQVAKRGEKSLESFVGKVLPVKVIEVNRRQGKIVLSHKLGSGEKENFNIGKLLEDLEVGQIRRGKVSSLKSFGAFVDIGGIEGLIHITELSWKRVKHPSEVLRIGDETEVFVLGVDKINKKVALGLRELQPDPWVNAGELYKPGQIVKAKILRFAKFGAFAELENGLEGLIHISELSKESVQRPDNAVKIGDTVEVKVLRVIPDEQKIGLSIREVLLDREKQVSKKEAAPPPVEEKKVTIGDMLAEKERLRSEEVETEEETESA
ncbi:S1 RNA-binding domain-containing protein [Candidatus Saganbacteria bacterium]|uniref:S1 RNA-binding domain-containing protein n=1 Tax=Candidatus Saganbacteria bacterium TaxID=2575572 RepID=A0A9D6UM17_UNCSA|nr:S1 RNA-binding domain-containing protein [Candidatus Saganbacteria bacterium]